MPELVIADAKLVLGSDYDGSDIGGIADKAAGAAGGIAEKAAGAVGGIAEKACNALAPGLINFLCKLIPGSAGITPKFVKFFLKMSTKHV